MSRILITLTAILCAVYSHGQTNLLDYNAIPGVGVGGLTIGISADSAQKILGKASIRRTFQEEYDLPHNFGAYNDSLVEYLVGFDYALEWEVADNYPIFKLFFRDESLVFMTLTSYSMNTAAVDKISTEGIRFYDSPAPMIEAFGQPDWFFKMGGYDGFYVYWTRGIELTYDNNELRVICIFEPALL